MASYLQSSLVTKLAETNGKQPLFVVMFPALSIGIEERDVAPW